MVSCARVEVAKVLADEDARKKLPLMERKVHGLEVSDPSESASCGAVDDASVNVHLGVVVPKPTAPRAESKALKATAPNDAPFLY